MRIASYLIEYLGEFEFIFETILDYESGDQMSSLMQKNRRRKSHAWAPLRKNAPQKDNPKQLFFGSIFFPVHSLEIFLQILYQKKFLDFLTPILTYFEVKNYHSYRYFLYICDTKYEIRNTRTKKRKMYVVF
jgi:hypothetical protein